MDTVERENIGMQLFMENLPAPEIFDAENVLEVYRRWRRMGIVGDWIETLEKEAREDAEGITCG